MTDLIRPTERVAATLTARVRTIDEDPTTGAPRRVRIDLYCDLAKPMGARTLGGEVFDAASFAVRCEGEPGQDVGYSVALHDADVRLCQVVDGLPEWLPELPEGWDAAAVEFAREASK